MHGNAKVSIDAMVTSTSIHLAPNLDQPMLVLSPSSKSSQRQHRNVYGSFVVSAVLCLWAAGSAMGGPPGQLWGGKAQSDWTRIDEAVVITDMTKCQPASALTPKLKKGHWRIIPYQMTNIPIRDVDGPPYAIWARD